MENLYDVIIIGGGPAGLTAAIYLARAKYRVLVAEKKEFGGQITITSEVVNYPGIMKISGKELTDNMRAQAQNFGAEFMIADVLGLDVSEKIKTVKTDKGDLKAFGILIATGAHPRMIGFDGEAEFKGHGVAYCATCDGEFFTDKEIFVVGGGYAAAEEAVFLTRYGKHVTILVREDDFTCAKAVADKAKEEGVEIRFYNIIYKAVEDMEAAMKGMLDPEFEEKVLGSAIIKQIFKFSKVGNIAGCSVSDGIIKRDSSARIIRDGVVIYDGKIGSLQHEKDSVKEVKKGYECGITIEGFNDIKVGDVIESYEMVEVKR